MAWPFSSVLAPNLGGDMVTVPTSSTSLSTSVCWLLGATFSTSGTVLRVVTITNTAGVHIAKFDVTPGSPVSIDWAFKKTTGVKWLVDAGSDTTGDIWGYF